MGLLETIPCFLIHREQDTIREPCIQALETALHCKVQRFEGISGDVLIATGFPTKHPHESVPTSPGNLGCTASHVEIIDAAIKDNKEYICIFEDDAEVMGDLDTYLMEVNTLPTSDMILLGTNEIVEAGSTELSTIKTVRRFWGTHAVILGRKAMNAILHTYKRYVNKGFALPADWLYSYAIKEEGLLAYAPTSSIIRQKPGLISFISGKVRA
jgi:GR25 family glycosyltransferase involved in LPS biosynthesis